MKILLTGCQPLSRLIVYIISQAIQPPEHTSKPAVPAQNLLHQCPPETNPPITPWIFQIRKVFILCTRRYHEYIPRMDIILLTPDLKKTFPIKPIMDYPIIDGYKLIRFCGTAFLIAALTEMNFFSQRISIRQYTDFFHKMQASAKRQKLPGRSIPLVDSL